MDTTTLGAALALAKSIPDTAVSEAAAVLEQAETIVASIPEDYSELSDDVVELKSAYNPVDKTVAMTQLVGKDGNGRLWTAPGSGGGGNAYYVTPEDFGALGDGVTDDTAAFEEAIAAADVLLLTGSYHIDPVTVTKSLEIVGVGGAKIITDAHTSAFTFAPTKKAQLTMAADYIHDDNTAESFGTRLSVDNVSGVVSGDLVYAYATNQPYSYARAYYYKGFAALVSEVDAESNSIYVDFSLPFDLLADGTVIDVYTPITVKVDGVEFVSALDDVSTAGSSALWIKYGAFCEVKNCGIDGYTSGLRLTGCVNSKISNLLLAHAKADNSDPWDGYGISIESCNGTSVDSVVGTVGQHAITTGGNLPVFCTLIRNSTLFAESTQYAFGAHDNNYSVTIEDSVIGGAWLVGNCAVSNVRIVDSGNEATKVLLTGNEGVGKTSAYFDNVHFDDGLEVIVSAYAQNPVRTYSNDFDTISFVNCSGGSLRVIDLSSNTDITGSSIERIKVDGWDDCLGFVLGYGTISELYLRSLLFRVTTEAGYITSQTARTINYPCVVLNEFDLDGLFSAVDSVGGKASAITADAFIHNSAKLDKTAAGKIDGLKIYGELVNDTPISAPTLTLVSGNRFDVLDGFSIHLEDYAINGAGAASQYVREVVIPANLKRKRVRLSCTIDATKANVTSINSVAAYLFDAEHNVIYETYLSGYYEAIEYESVVSFPVPDEAYSMLITGRLFATGEGKEITASNFKLAEVSSFATHTAGPALYAIPVSSGETYVDADGVKQFASYLDYDNGVQVRQVEYLYNHSITAEMVTPMLDYFDSTIVGGFIPASVVGKPDGIGRDLSAFYAIGRTVLETSTPPTNQESVWIDNGGIGFAFSVETVGERTISALVEYVNRLPDFLLCRLYATQYMPLRQTDVMLYRSLNGYDGETSVSSGSEAYYSLRYNLDTQSYVDGEDYRLIRDLTLSDSTARVYIAVDDDGKPFVLSDIVVKMELAAADGSSVGMIVPNVGDTQPSSTELNTLPGLSITTMFATSSQMRVARLHVNGGKFFGEAEYTAFSNYYNPLYTQVNRNAAGIYDCDKISSLTMFSINNHSFAAGSRFFVYGR